MNVAEKRELERRIRALEQRVAKLPTRIRTSAGGGGGGNTSGVARVYEADTKVELPPAEDVAETSFGRVITDENDELGMMCVINPAKDGWNAFTHAE
jgi:hypothetical protein